MQCIGPIFSVGQLVMQVAKKLDDPAYAAYPERLFAGALMLTKAALLLLRDRGRDFTGNVDERRFCPMQILGAELFGEGDQLSVPPGEWAFAHLQTMPQDLRLCLEQGIHPFNPWESSKVGVGRADRQPVLDRESCQVCIVNHFAGYVRAVQQPCENGSVPICG